MTTRPRIYLDHAATGWPKPEAVYEAMDRFARSVGAAAGRGAYRSATTAGGIVASCRRRLARLVGATDSSDVALFSNGTTALNAAIFGIIRPGDQVVTTAIEHNSVLRPLQHLVETADVHLDVVPCDQQGNVAAEAILDRVTPSTRLVAVSHGSNVIGSVIDVAKVGAAIASSDTLLLCDAAQTLGYLPLDVGAAQIDLLAAPGHKGAAGPLGTGVLVASAKARQQLRPTVFGGTGSQSESTRMPEEFPAMLEAGNLNVPALAGWDAGLGQLLDEHPAERARRFETMAELLAQRLSSIAGIRVIAGRRLPIASVTFDGLDVGTAAALLDSEYGIEVRSGLHCAALIHRHLGTSPDGTLRASCGHTSSEDEIEQLAEALRQLAGQSLA